MDELDVLNTRVVPKKRCCLLPPTRPQAYSRLVRRRTRRERTLSATIHLPPACSWFPNHKEVQAGQDESDSEEVSEVLIPYADDRSSSWSSATMNRKMPISPGLRPASLGMLFVNGNGSFVSRYSVSFVLQVYRKERCYDSTRFNTHSFRVGRASDLALKGASVQPIKEKGHWSRNTFINYLRFDLFATAPRVRGPLLFAHFGRRPLRVLLGF